MLNRYDRQNANRLVPLLKSITTEIRERAHDIERLERSLARLGRMVDATERERRRDAIDSNLSNHRREQRLAKRELERLGCALDLEHPLRVLIPGRDGKLGHGFAWNPEDGELISSTSAH